MVPKSTIPKSFGRLPSICDLGFRLLVVVGPVCILLRNGAFRNHAPSCLPLIALVD